MAESHSETEQKSNIDSEPLVSVIVPVYNTEEYLEYCLDSIISQTYKKLEIILIDDGSTDKSGEVCDKYRKRDKRIKVFHKENGGLSAARNFGLEHMQGEWVTFVDSDDYIHATMVMNMVRFALADCSQMVSVIHKKTAKEFPYSYNGNVNNKIVSRIYDRRVYQVDVLSGKLAMYSHGKLYKCELFESIRFPVGKLYEDVPTTWAISKLVDRVTVINKELYFYRQRLGSIVNSAFKPERMDQVYVAEDIYEEVKGNKLFEYTAGSRCFFSAADNYSLITDGYYQEKKYLECCMKKYRRDVLRDDNAKIGIKILAIISYLSLNLVRIFVKGKKRLNLILKY